MEITEKTIVSTDNYQEIKKMLLCNDAASVNLAMVLLEQSDYKESEVFILCLLKECYSEIITTNKNADKDYSELFNKVSKNLSKYNTELITLSFETIFNITKDKGDKKQLEFILDIFANELKDILKEFSFEFLNYLDLHLVVKGTPIKILYDEK